MFQPWYFPSGVIRCWWFVGVSGCLWEYLIFIKFISICHLCIESPNQMQKLSFYGYASTHGTLGHCFRTRVHFYFKKCNTASIYRRVMQYAHTIILAQSPCFEQTHRSCQLICTSICIWHFISPNYYELRVHNSENCVQMPPCSCGKESPIRCKIKAYLLECTHLHG